MSSLALDLYKEVAAATSAGESTDNIEDIVLNHALDRHSPVTNIIQYPPTPAVAAILKTLQSLPRNTKPEVFLRVLEANVVEASIVADRRSINNVPFTYALDLYYLDRRPAALFVVTDKKYCGIGHASPDLREFTAAPVLTDEMYHSLFKFVAHSGPAHMSPKQRSIVASIIAEKFSRKNPFRGSDILCLSKLEERIKECAKNPNEFEPAAQQHATRLQGCFMLENATDLSFDNLAFESLKGEMEKAETHIRRAAALLMDAGCLSTLDMLMLETAVEAHNIRSTRRSANRIWELLQQAQAKGRCCQNDTFVKGFWN